MNKQFLRNIFFMLAVVCLSASPPLRAAAEKNGGENGKGEGPQKAQAASTKAETAKGDVGKTERNEAAPPDRSLATKPVDKSADEDRGLALTPEGLKELEERERKVADREKELEEREKAIQVQEKVLEGKMQRIDEITKKMATRLDKFKEESEGKIAKLVTMLESMKPDAAAAYIESVEPQLAVEVLSRINISKAAKIMNKVDKEISARLSELYTGFRSRLERFEKSNADKSAANKVQPNKG